VAEVVIPYRPRPLQRELHAAVQRFNVIVAHRRFGKTVFCINHAIRAAFVEGKANARYGYVAPFRNQAKQVAWDYVKQFTAPIPGVSWNEAELRCDMPNGARLQLFGADNFDSMRGLYFDGVILDEYAQMAPSAWHAVIRPALADRRGWAIFIGTPMGRNAFHEMYERAKDEEGWRAFLYKASETDILPADELAAAKREMTAAMFAQEFECSFAAAIMGAVYGAEIEYAEKEGRICRVPYEKGLPVHTAWDLGIGDSTAILMFQIAGREIRVIDSIESFGVGLDWYVSELKSRPYVYGTHLLPHDVDVKELGTGRSRRETLSGYGLRCDVVPKQRIEEGINALRGVMSRMWFDSEKCRQAVEALRQYRYEYREKQNAFSAAPVHDWTSHVADAARYLAMGLHKVETASSKRVKQPDATWVT
jgi:phage terminase large subunit